MIGLDFINTETVMQTFIRAMSKFKYTFLADAITTVSPLVANIAAAYAKYYSI